jgi:hypothetical protein
VSQLSSCSVRDSQALGVMSDKKEIEKWERILREEGLSLHKGSPKWLSYVENTDPFQRERPHAVGQNGGILSQSYRLGDERKFARRKHPSSLVCKECSKAYESPRAHSIYCGQPCQKRAYRRAVKAVRTRSQSTNSEETR